MTSIVFSSIILFYIYTGVSSLKCHECIGSLTSPCAKGDTSTMAITTCQRTLPKLELQASAGAGSLTKAQGKNNETFVLVNKQIQVVLQIQCLHMELEVTNTTTSKVMKLCKTIVGKAPICEIMKKKHSNLKSCKSCGTDTCN